MKNHIRKVSVICFLTYNTVALAQNPKFERMNRLISHFEKDYSSHEVDSIIQYNLIDKTKKILPFKKETVTKSIKPHIGKYSPLYLKKYKSLPKLKESEASFLFRTRDLVDNMKQFPITSVTKMLKYKKGKRTTGCTATFVNERFLITAAHCIYNPKEGYPDKVELKILYDNGVGEKTVDVKKVYHKKHYQEGTPFDANSYDISLIEIEEPLGKDLGYLGLFSQTELNNRLNTWQTMYSLSYPHISSADLKEIEMNNEKVDSLKNKYKAEIQKSRGATPDFNKRNQYFEVLNVFLDNQKNYKYIMPYSIPGKSGSARISEDYYLYGVRSVFLNNYKTSMDIMLRNEILNSFIQIMNKSED